VKRAASLVIPPKYISGCQGDMIEARRRWDITRKWREDYKIDTVSLPSLYPVHETAETLLWFIASNKADK
jgi:hypothetical protein